VKGWFHDPYRHALAAKGIRFRFKDPSTRYLYHGTSSNRLSKIRQIGLKHDLEDRIYCISEDYVYFTTSERDAFGWGFDALNELKYSYSDPKTGELLPEAPDWIKKANSVVLRVKIDDMISMGAIEYDPYRRYPISEDYNMDVKSPVDIPPEMIEVKTVSGWRPLK